MSEKKVTSSFAVKLLKPHTHADKAYAVDDVIAAEDLNQPTADWLVAKQIGAKAPAATATKKD